MNNNTIIIATIKSWNIRNAQKLKDKLKRNYTVDIITDNKDLTLETVKNIKPKYIFFPHWSWMIDKDIYSNYTCICFHETDLPFGRGGTPIQNLILSGYKKTKISAFKVNNILDGGPIYIKKSLKLSGTVEDILKRSSKIIFTKLIPYILNNHSIPKTQKGTIKLFQRLLPSDSKIEDNISIDKLYDKIRMLDGEGYPKAYLETEKYKIYFYSAKKENDYINAKTIIEKK